VRENPWLQLQGATKLRSAPQWRDVPPIADIALAASLLLDDDSEDDGREA